MRVLVIGAGLGGLTLAQGLIDRGVDVEVFEKDSGSVVRAQGARFHLDERGRSALRVCLPAAQFAMIEATLGQPSTSLKIVTGLDLVDEQPFNGDARPGTSASRQLVRRTLAHGVDVQYGKCLARFDREPHGVVAHFTDGSTARGDVLVGADGIGSTVRSQYLPHARIIDSGLRWLGGKTPLTAVSADLVDLIGGSFTVTNAAAVPMIVAALKFREPPTEAAARLMPGFDPGDVEDYLMWALLPPHLEKSLLVQAQELVADAHPLLRKVVADAWPDQYYGLRLGTSEPVRPWPTTNVTLLGDAIHAMLPSRGSGANMALRDARRLCEHLTGPQNLLPAIAEYEEEMRRDGFAAVAASVAAEITIPGQG